MQMNKALQIETLKKSLQSRGISWDTVDLDALIDETLHLDENLNAILTALKIPETDIKFLKEQNICNQLDTIHNIETQTKEAEFKAIEELKKKSNTDIDAYYKIPIEYVKMVAKGYRDSLILLGQAGIGKTFTIVRTLNREVGKEGFVLTRGCKSPLALYRFLYQHSQDELIVFDDVFGLLEDDRAATLLLGAADTALSERILSWDTTSGRLEDIPAKFIFRSRIIIIANEMPRTLSRVEAMLSRSLIHTVKFSHSEIIKLMYEIAHIPKKGLTETDRIAIVDFINENSDETTELVDLRTQEKIEAMYKYSKNGWKDLALALLDKKDTKLSIVKDILKTEVDLTKQISKFRDQTGLSRATFYRYKEELDSLKSQNLTNGGI